MTPELAKLALQFLERVTLRPAEIAALQSVAGALQTIAFPPPAPPAPTKDPE